jgi:hypothetical protein
MFIEEGPLPLPFNKTQWMWQSIMAYNIIKIMRESGVIFLYARLVT